MLAVRLQAPSVHHAMALCFLKRGLQQPQQQRCKTLIEKKRGHFHCQSSRSKSLSKRMDETPEAPPPPDTLYILPREPTGL